MLKKEYFFEIDSLRAVAIILVILFHLDFLLIGYLGVDIFFVISGYLITYIALEKNITYKLFLERRVRRIFPLLFFGSLVALIFSYFFLFPFEFKEFGQSLVSTATYSTNFLFLKQSGYFENISKARPLLHTWSLSMEIQFYIIFFSLFFLTKKLGTNKLKKIIIFFSIVSLLVSLVISINFENIIKIKTENIIFYSPFLRFWEFGLGSLVFFYKNKEGLRNYKYLPITTLICFSFIIILFLNNFNYNSFNIIPNIIVVIFTILIIFFSKKLYLFKIISKIKYFNYIGKISYSLYLWHFIFLSIYRNYSLSDSNLGTNNDILIKIIIIIASFFLSILSFKYIETPFRDFNFINSAKFRKLLILFSMILIFLGLTIHFKNGFPERFSKEVLNLYMSQNDRNPRQSECTYQNFKNSCKIGSTNQLVNTVLWGDSHAEMLFVSFDSFLKKNNISGIFIHNCNDIIFSTKDLSNECLNFYNEFDEKIIKNDDIKYIIISNRWKNRISKSEIYEKKEISQDERNKMDNAINLLNYILENNKKVLLFYPFPEQLYHVPFVISKLKNKNQKIEEYITDKKKYLDRNLIVFEYLNKIKSTNLTKVLPHKILCKNKCSISKGNIILYYDADHFSVSGANYFLNTIDKELKDFFNIR
jgi:peptidoglycan/LPS O-acetylase OafA/YrhL